MEPYHQADGVTLYLGDVLAVLPSLPTGSVDAVIADPPYSSGGVTTAERKQSTRVKYVTGRLGDIIYERPDFPGDRRDQRGWAHWMALWLGEALRVTKPGGSVLIFTDWRQLPAASDALQAAGWTWRGIVTWVKPRSRSRPTRGGFWGQAEYVLWGVNGSLRRDHDVYLPGVIEAAAPRGAERLHQTEKPVELLRTLVRVCPAGGMVLDPFAGSGSAGVAARLEGRAVVAVELAEYYAAMARDRLSDPAAL